MASTPVNRFISRIATVGGSLAIAIAILGIGITVVGLVAVVNIVITLVMAGQWP